MKTDDLTSEDLQVLAMGLQMRISGKIGKFVFYQTYGKMHVRRRPAKRDPAVTFTEKQENNHKRFLAVTRHARSLRNTVIEPIWDKVAKPKKKSGYSLFLKTNNPAFDATGQIPDPLLLHFSAGPLNLPNALKATVNHENSCAVDIEWDFNSKYSGSFEDDCLMYIQYPMETIEMVDTGFKRKDQKVSLELPPSEEKDLYLFLFFWDKHKKSYSPDQAFKIR